MILYMLMTFFHFSSILLYLLSHIKIVICNYVKLLIEYIEYFFNLTLMIMISTDSKQV